MKHANISIFVPHVGCPNQCSFCNQHSISSSLTIPDGDFVKKLLSQAISEFKGNLKDAQIAFFGGSFTAINRNYMTQLLNSAGDFVEKGLVI